jgi:cell division protein FtsW (lipid II flippase)
MIFLLFITFAAGFFATLIADQRWRNGLLIAVVLVLLVVALLSAFGHGVSINVR